MALLLITGAIDIENFRLPLTHLTQTKTRLKQYIDSLEFAIENYHLIDKIVFCENTNYRYDYTTLQGKARLHNKILEILTFNGDYLNIQQRGKGYGEGEIVAFAIQNSAYLKNEKSIFKLTGRLIIQNMDSIISSTSNKSALIYKDKVLTDRGSNFFETYFYKLETSVLENTVGSSWKECNDLAHIYLEHIFFMQLKTFPIRSFSAFPKVKGILGSTGKNYTSGITQSTINKLYNKLGFYNWDKTPAEKLIFQLWLSLLRIKRCLNLPRITR